MTLTSGSIVIKRFLPIVVDYSQVEGVPMYRDKAEG